MGFVANYLRNLPAVLAGAQPTRPLLFSWYVTHRCALSCEYCCDGEGRPFKDLGSRELSVPEAERLLRLLRREADTLDITGGEPLVREDLEELLGTAKRLGFRIALNTKGIGLPDRAELLRTCDVVALSVDSLDPSRLAKIIGKPQEVAEKVLKALDFCLAHRERLGFKLVLAAVAMPGNLDDVEAVVSLAQKHRLGLHLSPQIVGTAVHSELRSHPGWARLAQRLVEIKKSGLEVLGVPEYVAGIRDLARYRCMPLLMPTLRPDGRACYPCLDFVKAEVDVVEAGGWGPALERARQQAGPIPDCGDRCQIFCHMAPSLLQQHPLSALGELRHWS
ncbi:MAG TPA: radical SAM protein [Myxococcales bacterium]|jgi:MoaA/NifB/PqqE/SkfB family radical SAM enzyme